MGTPLQVYTYIFLQGVQDERFQLTQALVDSCSPSLFHDGFGGLEIRDTQ